MTPPLSRQMPCPYCGHDHRFMACDQCSHGPYAAPGEYIKIELVPIKKPGDI